MKFNIAYDYSEEMIPKRCRLPRRVTFSAKTTIAVKEISGENAPIAIIIRHTLGEPDTLLRYYKGKFWQPKTRTGCQEGWDPKPMPCEIYSGYGYYTKKETLRAMRKNANSFLMIDGVPYEKTGEPRYVINTFGLGHNHGGTAVFIDSGYNSNIPNSRYFRIDQRKAVIEEAERIAANRGDTDNIPISMWYDCDILMPETIKLKPMKQHGGGCPFINKLENAINASPDKTTAGLLVLAAAMKEIY